MSGSSAQGHALPSFVEGRNAGTVRFRETTLPAGSRVRVRWWSTSASASAVRFLYGGDRYGDAGITPGRRGALVTAEPSSA